MCENLIGNIADMTCLKEVVKGPHSAHGLLVEKCQVRGLKGKTMERRGGPKCSYTQEARIKGNKQKASFNSKLIVTTKKNKEHRKKESRTKTKVVQQSAKKKAKYKSNMEISIPKHTRQEEHGQPKTEYKQKTMTGHGVKETHRLNTQTLMT